jgi:hypothetical protein
MARALIITLLAGCGALDFETKQFITEVTVDGDPRGARIGAQVAQDTIPTQEWATELPQEPAGIFLESMVLQITDTALDGQDEDDFGFVDEVVFYVRATDDSVPRRPIAWGYEPGPVTAWTLTANRAVNLVPYILAGFEITSELRARVPEDRVSFDGVANLLVDIL